MKETKCENCGIPVEDPFADESKIAEYEENYGLKVETVPTVTICDDCFYDFMAKMNKAAQSN